jgi:hypothetical protein
VRARQSKARQIKARQGNSSDQATNPGVHALGEVVHGGGHGADELVGAIRVPVKALNEQWSVRVAVAQLLHARGCDCPRRVQRLLDDLRLEHGYGAAVFVHTAQAKIRIRLAEGVLHVVQQQGVCAVACLSVRAVEGNGYI